MALYKKSNHDGVFGEAMMQIETAIVTGALQAPGTIVNDMIGFESIDATAKEAVIATEQAARQFLCQEVGFDEVLRDHLGVESVDHACVQNGLDAAASTMMAAVSPEEYHHAFTANRPAAEGVRIFAGAQDAESFSMEGYSNFQFKDFLGASVVANALAAASSPLAETFFRTVVLSPSTPGLDIEITEPRIFTKTTRDVKAIPYDIGKQSVVRAVIDHTILENNATQIVPVVRTNAANNVMLVPAAEVATKTVTIGGKQVNTRPIVYGKKVDLISISSSDTLIAAEVQDDTDTLDPAVNMGTQFVKITNGAKSAAFALDISNIRGSLFAQQAEGWTKDMTANFSGKVWLASDGEAVTKVSSETALAIATVLGVSTSTPWRIELNLDLAGVVNYNESNMIVRFHEASIGNAYTGTDNTLVDPAGTEYTNLKAALKFDGLGYLPNATRSNENMRDLGTLIDVGDVIRARIPVVMQSPLSIVNSTGSSKATSTMDAINMVKRVRNSNMAITELLKFEQQLIATKDMLNGSPAIGSMVGIKPTHIVKSLDVNKQVVIFGSSRSLDELTGAVSAAVAMTANQLLLDSGYLASIEMFTGSTSNFEIIVGTDPLIESLLMKSGDNRTLGNNRNYNISSSQDARMRNKIYISVRRTDVDGADPHSFGVHPTMPALIHSATVSRSGATNQELQVVPREAFRVTTPMLARIDVTNLEKIFTA